MLGEWNFKRWCASLLHTFKIYSACIHNKFFPLNLFLCAILHELFCFYMWCCTNYLNTIVSIQTVTEISCMVWYECNIKITERDGDCSLSKQETKTLSFSTIFPLFYVLCCPCILSLKNSHAKIRYMFFIYT